MKNTQKQPERNQGLPLSNADKTHAIGLALRMGIDPKRIAGALNMTDKEFKAHKPTGQSL